MWKYYRSSAIVTVICAAIGYALMGVQGLMITLILGVLETSLSFDNAIVNASVLKNWDARWRRYFLVYGLPIAVFGMRLVFPLAIVSVATGLGPIDVINLVVDQPKEYQRIIESVHHEVAAFGGTFLAMVGLTYLFDSSKDVHWIPGVERFMAWCGKINPAPIMALIAVMATSTQLPATEQLVFIESGLWGLITYMLVQALGTMTGGENVEETVIKQGIGGFMYLELVDASFSFDGVIAAFALTNSIFVMAAGLTIGAMFVRSMTLHLVDEGTLAKYEYLEPAAFWAIIVLAVCMFAGTFVHIPEVVTGLTGAGLIALGVVTSMKRSK